VTGKTLTDHLRRRIEAQGPLSVADFMGDALGHPQFGYYMTRDPLGAAGDFITAPEISQMFGELIGLWCVVQWRSMGAPDPFRLVELGPGRGTLMADILRAAGGASPEFTAALGVHLVETSPILRAAQAKALASIRPGPAWHERFDDVPGGPLIVIANEFFDALGVRQFERSSEDWRERLVDSDGDGFCFILSPPLESPPALPPGLGSLRVGDVVEVSPAGLEIAAALGRRLAATGGAALIIDYGHSQSAAGDTLQAVKGHAYFGVLDTPGEADLTAHVDFAALGRAAAAPGAAVYGPMGQGAFLDSLGLGARAATLIAETSPGRAREITAARARLSGSMGELFKVMVFTAPGLLPPPGFD
jgi:NADH dehydrogenase [ubiquinone] 1 alpha subcomplex assembly factor 7